jgi:hypothetical protein
MESIDSNDGAFRGGEPPYFGRTSRSCYERPNSDTKWKIWTAWYLAIPGAILLLPIFFLSIAREPMSPLPPRVIQHEPWFINGDPAKRPFASRHGTTITLEPSKASLIIPDSWTEWYEERGNNIHLTREQIDCVARGDGEFHTEFASVCNTVLPFDRCSLHAGGEGWGREHVAGIDFWMRAYDLQEAPEAVELRIAGEGLADAKRLSRKTPVLTRDLKSQWRQTCLAFEVFYFDGAHAFMGTAIVDFRIQRFEKQTFAFVFMYSDYQPHGNEIASILASFKAR